MNTTSEDSEYETLEEDNGGSVSSRSSRSRRGSFSEDGDNLSDDLIIKDEREDGDGQEVSAYCHGIRFYSKQHNLLSFSGVELLVDN